MILVQLMQTVEKVETYNLGVDNVIQAKNAGIGQMDGSLKLMEPE